MVSFKASSTLIRAPFGKVALDVFGPINKTIIAAALLREVVS